MIEINLSNLDTEELDGLIGKAQSEIASRETQKRRDLRTELDHRIRSEGYQLSDIFPELAKGITDEPRRRKMPAKFQNPQDRRQTWSGIGRSPKWVQAIIEEHAIDVKAFKRLPTYQIT